METGQLRRRIAAVAPPAVAVIPRVAAVAPPAVTVIPPAVAVIPPTDSLTPAVGAIPAKPTSLVVRENIHGSVIAQNASPRRGYPQDP
ncbi:MAG TPA: hypothetical protein VLI70_11020 [Micrococcaceae bacterium]|nr:hypothetical protein [Micrococcaceae bacterium]